MDVTELPPLIRNNVTENKTLFRRIEKREKRETDVNDLAN